MDPHPNRLRDPVVRRNTGRRQEFDGTGTPFLTLRKQVRGDDVWVLSYLDARGDPAEFVTGLGWERLTEARRSSRDHLDGVRDMDGFVQVDQPEDQDRSAHDDDMWRLLKGGRSTP